MVSKFREFIKLLSFQSKYIILNQEEEAVILSVLVNLKIKANRINVPIHFLVALPETMEEKSVALIKEFYANKLPISYLDPLKISDEKALTLEWVEEQLKNFTDNIFLTNK